MRNGLIRFHHGNALGPPHLALALFATGPTARRMSKILAGPCGGRKKNWNSEFISVAYILSTTKRTAGDPPPISPPRSPSSCLYLHA